jgi:hypothetical protein
VREVRGAREVGGEEFPLSDASYTFNTDEFVSGSASSYAITHQPIVKVFSPPI